MEQPPATTARKPTSPTLRQLVWWTIWFCLAGAVLIRLPIEVSYWMLALAEKASLEGRTDEALAWVERAKPLTPDSLLPRKVAARAKQRAGKLDELDRIDLVLEDKDLRPDDRAALHLEKSHLLKRKSRYDEALVELDEAAKYRGKLRPSLERFELLKLARREEDAQREFDQLLEASATDSERARTRLWKAGFHKQRSEFAEALQEFDKAAELEPKLRPSTDRLQLLMLANKQSEAEEEAKQLLQASDSDAEKAKVHLTLSLIHRSQGRWNEALQEFDEAARLDSDLGSNGERLELLLLADKRDEARDELDKVKKQLGKAWWRSQANINNTIAYFGALLGDDLEQALVLANKAIDTQRNNSAFLDTRAYVLHRLDRHEEALPDANRAVEEMEKLYDEGSAAELRRAFAVIVYHRSLILDALGKSVEALQDRERVRELGFEPDERLF